MVAGFLMCLFIDDLLPRCLLLLQFNDVLWLAWMCDECTWHHKIFLVQLYWHLAIKLYGIWLELGRQNPFVYLLRGVNLVVVCWIVNASIGMTVYVGAAWPLLSSLTLLLLCTSSVSPAAYYTKCILIIIIERFLLPTSLCHRLLHQNRNKRDVLWEALEGVG